MDLNLTTNVENPARKRIKYITDARWLVKTYHICEIEELSRHGVEKSYFYCANGWE